MNDLTLDRRDLNRLALAALGGLLTGAMAGCSGKPTGSAKSRSSNSPGAGGEGMSQT